MVHCTLPQILQFLNENSWWWVMFFCEGLEVCLVLLSQILAITRWQFHTCDLMNIVHCNRSQNKLFSHWITISKKNQHLQCKRSINRDIRWCNLNSRGSLECRVQQAEVFWFTAISEGIPSRWIRSWYKLSVVPRVSSLKRCGSAEKISIA